jgi:hypothetical protein
MKPSNDFVPEEFTFVFRSIIATMIDYTMTEKNYNSTRFWHAWRKAFVNSGYNKRQVINEKT